MRQWLLVVAGLSTAFQFPGSASLRFPGAVPARGAPPPRRYPASSARAEAPRTDAGAGAWAGCGAALAVAAAAASVRPIAALGSAGRSAAVDGSAALLGRRAATVRLAGLLLAPALPAHAISGAEFPGSVQQPAFITEDIPDSITYSDFLDAVNARKIEGVVFQPPSGDVAFALINGKSVRIGKGWPLEVSTSDVSPRYVQDLLNKADIPYAWNFNLKAKNAKGY